MMGIKLLVNNKGLSILTTLMISGVVLVGIISINTLFLNQKKDHMRKLSADNADQLLEEMKLILSEKDGCTHNFTGAYLTQDKNISQIFKESGNILQFETEAQNAAAKYHNDTLNIQSINLSGFTEDSPGSLIGTGELRVVFKSLKGVTQNLVYSRKATVWIELDAPKQNIVSCGMSPEGLVWRKRGDDIFFNGGKVGLGISNPEFSFDVHYRNLSGTDPTTFLIGAQDAIPMALDFYDGNFKIQPASDNDSIYMGLDTMGGATPVYIKHGVGVTVNEPNPDLIPGSSALSIRSSSAMPHMSVRSNPNDDTQAWQFTMDDDDADLNLGRQGGGGTFIADHDDVRITSGARPDATYNFYVTGLAGGSTAWANISDQRLKTHIRPLESVLDKIAQLTCYTYTFKSDPEKKTQMGLITQEVERVFPEFVVKGERYDSLKYSPMTAVATKAVQELAEQIENSNQKLDAWLTQLDNEL